MSPWPLRASVQTGSARGAPPGEDPLTVYLMTMGPGEQVWERFGHNALWIHDARTSEDLVWNWGLFSFSQAGFVPRLIRGRMLYAMAGLSLTATLAEYRAAGRDVWVQELALTPSQEAELNRLVRTNALPENRLYQYDYYRDNCSTRVRDALDAVLGGQLRTRYEVRATPYTWRWHTLRLLRELPLVRAGVQIVLGNPGDETITEYEAMFLPMQLRASVAAMSVRGPDGRPQPLVVRETQLVEGGRGPEPAAPDDRTPTFLLLGLVPAALLVGLARWARSGRLGPRLGVAVLAGGWGLVAGLVGLVLVGAYFTDHVFWYRNENLLQASPFSLGLVVVGARYLVRGRVGLAGMWVARLVALASLAGIAAKLLPGFGQANQEIIALALPLNLAVAWVWGRGSSGAGHGVEEERVVAGAASAG